MKKNTTKLINSNIDALKNINLKRDTLKTQYSYFFKSSKSCNNFNLVNSASRKR